MKGINTELWSWLKSHAFLEGKTIGELLNELIAWYRAEVESTGVWLREPVRSRNTHGQLSVSGLDLELLTWIRAHARLNRITVGDIVNDAIELYRTEVEQSGESLGRAYRWSGELVTNTVKGVDRQLWRYLKDRAAVEDMTMGEMVNELISRYRRQVPEDQKIGPSTF